MESQDRQDNAQNVPASTEARIMESKAYHEDLKAKKEKKKKREGRKPADEIYVQNGNKVVRKYKWEKNGNTYSEYVGKVKHVGHLLKKQGFKK